MLKQTNDAAFFEMVHSLIGEQEPVAEKERRTNDRRAYRCIQLLAPYDGVRLPAQAEFRKVQCHDISAHGFSYLTSQPPESEYVVICLGAIPFLFYDAEIVHYNAVQQGGSVEYLVGCRLRRRISR